MRDVHPAPISVAPGQHYLRPVCCDVPLLNDLSQETPLAFTTVGYCICAVNHVRVTLRNVAATAKLSVSAVSQALRNQPAIPAATRARVRAVADRLGYRPDPALAALNHYRHQRHAVQGVVLAYLTAFSTREEWRKNPYFLRTYNGAFARAKLLGYRLEHFWLNEPGLNTDRFCDILEHRGIRGLVIAPLPEPAGKLNLRWSSFAAVAIGPSLVEPPLHSACNNHYQSMLLVLDQLSRRGYKRFGLVLDPKVDQRHQRKYQAALSIYHVDGRRGPRPLLAVSPSDVMLRVWLDKEAPDVVIAHDENLLNQIIKVGRHVPHDIGFACLILGQTRTVSGIDAEPEKIAGFAIDRLASMLHEGEYSLPELPTCTMLNGRWIAGNTLR